MRKKRIWTASLALASLLTFTLGPVCGSATDVDADACCERHSQTDCAGKAPRSEQHPTPEECCQSGHLLYPVAKMEAKVHVAPVPHANLPVLDRAEVFVPAFSAPSSLPESVRSPGAPLYELTATYRL